MLIPKNPELVIERSANGVPIRYCLDATTERAMQNQRLAAMAVSPMLVYAAYKLDGPLWLRAIIGASGAACFYSSLMAYRVVRQAEKL